MSDNEESFDTREYAYASKKGEQIARWVASVSPEPLTTATQQVDYLDDAYLPPVQRTAMRHVGRVEMDSRQRVRSPPPRPLDIDDEFRSPSQAYPNLLHAAVARRAADAAVFDLDLDDTPPSPLHNGNTSPPLLVAHETKPVLTPIQSAVLQQFSSASLTDHVCHDSVRALFVGAERNRTGTNAHYAIFAGEHSSLNTTAMLTDADRSPPHMSRRGPFTPAALTRRAELRGTILALSTVARLPLRPACVHMCINSTYVAKAWGTWIPQWELHGWPGREVQPPRTKPGMPQRGLDPNDGEPRTPKRTPSISRTETNDSSSFASSESPAATDSTASASGRRTRRLVDEDLLRELAALRAQLAVLDSRGGPRVHLYLIEREHNPADALAVHASDVAEEVTPRLRSQRSEPLLEQRVAPQSLHRQSPALHVTPVLAPVAREIPTSIHALETMHLYEPKHAFSPPRVAAALSNERQRTMLSPLPDEVLLNSPREDMGRPPSRARSPVSRLAAASPVMGLGLVAGTSDEPFERPWSRRERSDMGMSSSRRPVHPLATKTSASSLRVTHSPDEMTQKPNKPMTSAQKTVSVTENEPTAEKDVPLTAQALREHDRKTERGHWFKRRTPSRPSSRTSARSEGNVPLLHRFLPRFFRRLEEPVPALPPAVDAQVESPGRIPRPKLHTVASQPLLRRARNDERDGTVPVDHGSTTTHAAENPCKSSPGTPILLSASPQMPEAASKARGFPSNGLKSPRQTDSPPCKSPTLYNASTSVVQVTPSPALKAGSTHPPEGPIKSVNIAPSELKAAPPVRISHDSSDSRSSIEPGEYTDWLWDATGPRRAPQPPLVHVSTLGGPPHRSDWREAFTTQPRARSRLASAPESATEDNDSFGRSAPLRQSSPYAASRLFNFTKLTYASQGGAAHAPSESDESHS